MEPNGTLFEQLPTEIHLIISKHIERGYGSLKALTRVNKRLRAVHHRRLFSRMLIHGGLDRTILASLLFSFCEVNRTDSVKNLQSLVTHATLAGGRERLESVWKDYVRDEEISVRSIEFSGGVGWVDLLAASFFQMPNLHTLTVDTKELEWEEEERLLSRFSSGRPLRLQNIELHLYAPLHAWIGAVREARSGSL